MSVALTSDPNARGQAELTLDGTGTTALDPELAADLWLAERIVAHTGIREALFHEVLRDPPARRERLRRTILENGLATVGLGRHRGKFETYAAHFERRFGEAL